jgi:hypothetical protein
MARGWAYYNQAIESDTNLIIKRVGKGYVGHEIAKLMSEVDNCG